ncbi:MAG: SRPBCC family protein [Hyphomicrobiales bacterium]|nr:SRPBCC family protein [Hyphomicrobiales bacterium]
MQFLKWLLWMFVIAFVGIVMVGFMLPRDIAVTRSMDIDVPVERVFAEINRPAASKDWVPWGTLDADTVFSFSGPEEGYDARMKWENPKFRDYGRGLQTIVVSERNRRVVSELNLEKMGDARADFELAELGTGTRVTATFATNLGHSPFGRWLGLLLDDWLTEDLDSALGKLKTKLETAPVPVEVRPLSDGAQTPAAEQPAMPGTAPAQ